MNMFCQKNGIVLETRVPYTPEQNGIAERAITVFFEMVRCMLHASKMDLRYWGEAFLYAVHIRSLTHTSALNNIVPAHAWSGTKLDVSHLQIFGSVAYANTPKKVCGGKLEVTSIKCRLLGWWADEMKGYRLEVVETGKIITAWDVHFAEDDSPGDLAVIETRGVAPTEAEIDRLVPDDVFGKMAGLVSPISQSKSSPQPAAAVEPPIPSVDDGTTYHHETTLGANENLQFPQEMKLLKKSSYLHLIAPSTIVLLLPIRMRLKHTSRLCGHPTRSSGRRRL